MVKGEFFPWLELETSVSKVTAGVKWSALNLVFELGYNRPLLDFALVVLKHIFDASKDAEEPLAWPDRMYQLYTYLQSKVDESSDHEECRGMIR